METNKSKFEKEVASLRAMLSRVDTKEGLKEEEFQAIRHFHLNTVIMKAVEEVLDSGVRNLQDERGDATEYALAINLN